MKPKNPPAFFRSFPTGIFFILIIYVLFFPDKSSENVIDGCALFFNSVFPSLFPFFVLSGYAVNSGIDSSLGKLFGIIPRLLKINSGQYAYIISVLSGYPTSAKVVCEGYLQGKITKSDAQKLLILCSNASAAFIISYIGGALLRNNTATFILLTANYLSPVCASVMLSLSYNESNAPLKQTDSSPGSGAVTAFVTAVKDSVTSILNVGAYIIIFSVIIGMFECFLGKSEISSLIYSLLEMSRGCSDVSKLDLIYPLRLGIMGFIIGFGGLCVMFQNYSFIEKTDLDQNIFFRYKIITGIFGFIISYILSTIFIAGNISVFNPMNEGNEMLFADANILLLMLMLIIILYTVIYFKADNEDENKRNFNMGGRRA